MDNSLVIAGPGAGKTELLAQRACYLLETGICPHPKRILAISLKRDAAKNLSDRVTKRVGNELSRRFDSFTFDAFAKSILDRFRAALPADFMPTADYAIDFKLGNDRPFREIMEAEADPSAGLGMDTIQGFKASEFYRDYFTGMPLSPGKESDSLEALLSSRIWHTLLKSRTPSALNFHMIARLAQLLLRSNDDVLKALRATYAFVFLDEFQDTTTVHYSLVRTMFRNGPAVMTAVGDEKQRIMVWAGALKGVFGHFKKDFGATARGLKMNYRSAPELVRIQKHLIAALDPSATLPEASDDGADGNGECRVLAFQDEDRETSHLSGLIQRWLADERLQPRDICVLVRGRAEHYTTMLSHKLASAGVSSRIENDFQDLLVEPVVQTVLHAIKFATERRAPDSWEYLRSLWLQVRSYPEDESSAREAERELLGFRKALRPQLIDEPNVAEAADIVRQAVEFFGSSRLRATFAQYQQGGYFDEMVANCVKELGAARSRSANWAAAVEDFEGKNSVPIMTVHKSKGLEYHSVIFVGLEDSALWGFSSNKDEETCAFFVAFSRAKKRVLFTFCSRRPDPRNGRLTQQWRRTIAPLYALLKTAGITPEEMF